ncbi:uncharacterized protein CIMG_04364 [Coccidioides immitis RS]|uniref:Uncharacterized protein n=3 Tax=Coccidioides immitis TaxID=5501 RepID=A0A0E1RYT2_COCIM|nr:uncharacterized protein CIMG_04364 [Coccidioides immitis RS]EAS33340.1 hypothetical protein CIMG_04364 [Coccidioides immitis RS]KMP04495.1 hypothetical protein CIRG_04176 [Coccidioides immitis RMSCC 2394]KMU76073.1 hypothetical protein CISG_05331 [Coccidioides immitis RMSCC 3703]TPX21096.1 hypothetical protein DIZ76_015049 [Coccidioides immitis]
MAGRLSPTANLLRKSRLFSLPQSLSHPATPTSSSTVVESDTATLPFPIRAAIATPPSSLARGDWGLKRPLPAKSTTESSSSPVVRVNHLDTFEHVTDFESAADHATTLKKWQELFLPLSTVLNTGIPSAAGGGRHLSVFEKSADNTHESKNVDDLNAKRFRFKGPWLAGQTETEFQNYLKSVRKQRPQFLQRLRQVLAERKASESRKALLDRGEPIGERQVSQELSDEEFETALRALRANPEALGPEIHKFLDLATPPNVPDQYLTRRRWTAGPSNISSTEYVTHGPPTTHPSAGLSYLRTKAHMDNHPVVGPQQQPKPVEARVLSAKRAQKLRTVIGVGGIVVDDLKSQGWRQNRSLGGPVGPDPDAPGGSKYWVKAERAAIRSDGRVELQVGRPSEAAKSLIGVSDAQQSSVSLPKNLFRSVPRLDT